MPPSRKTIHHRDTEDTKTENVTGRPQRPQRQIYLNRRQ
jgi:hypothetical protein